MFPLFYFEGREGFVYSCKWMGLNTARSCDNREPSFEAQETYFPPLS